MKYFFLSESWTTGRVWEFGGLWNELAWNRKPHLQRQPLYIQENGENLWLYQAEDAILMVEVMPKSVERSAIGQVVLKRLLSAEQVVEKLCKEAVFHPPNFQVAPTANHEKQVHEQKNEPFAKAVLEPAHQVVNNNDKKIARRSSAVMARLRRFAGRRSAEKVSHSQRASV